MWQIGRGNFSGLPNYGIRQTKRNTNIMKDRKWEWDMKLAEHPCESSEENSCPESNSFQLNMIWYLFIFDAQDMSSQILQLP